jgi:thioredoxin-like negative regulator of GroEL
MLAMTLAGLITAGAFARRRTRRLPILAAVGAALILSVCLLGWLGLKDSVAGRLATLYGQSAQADARLGNWRDAWGAVRDFGLLGSGLGTYRYIYLPYERQESTVWFYHAENQYLQTLVEAGAVGLTCLAAALALMLLAIGGLLGSRELQSAEGVAFVGLFAFASQALHALTDFGLFLPANFLAFALVCGAVVGRAGLLEVRGAFVNLPAWRFLTPRVVGLLALAGILSNGVAGYREIAAAASVEAAAHRLPQLTRPDAYTASALQEQIQQLQAALPARPDDATLHRALAQLWIYRYRHQTYIQLRSQTPEASAADQLWRATDLLPLHREINRLWQADDRQHLLALLSEPAVCENLVPAVRHLRAAQACCPLLTNLDLPLAALAFVDNPQEPTGAAHLRHAVLIAPSDPDVLFQAGLLASQAKLEELAWNCWRRSLQLSPRHLGDVLAQVNGQITIPQLLDQLLPDTPELLIGLARGAVRIQVGEEERASLLARAKRQLAAQKGKLPEDRWQYASAGLLRLENQPAAAADAYRRALRLKPDALEWRVELADFWEEQGRLEEALSEARRCAWAAPDRADIQQLLARLHRTQLQRPQPLR